MSDAINALQAKESQDSSSEPASNQDPHAGLRALVDQAQSAAAPTLSEPAPTSSNPMAGYAEHMKSNRTTPLPPVTNASPEGPTPRELRYSRSQQAPNVTAPAVAPIPEPDRSIPPGSPWHDAAKPILDAAPISNDLKMQAWDAFHLSPDVATLTEKLTPMPIPDTLKHQLWQQKQAMTPAVAPVDKVTSAIQKMADLEAATPGFLDKVEKYPSVLKAITGAATKG